MNHAEMVALIRGGVEPPKAGGVWADLGAGGGNFTRALGELLGPDGLIHAVDRVLQPGRALTLGPNAARVVWHQADFTQPMPFLAQAPAGDVQSANVDGILAANALHFVHRDAQSAALRHIWGYIRPGGVLVIVEYETQRLSYVPHPVSLERLGVLCAAIGRPPPEQIAARRSPSTGTTMYVARLR